MSTTLPPLLAASRRGQTVEVQRMLDQAAAVGLLGQLVNSCDRYHGDTALNFACAGGHTEAASVLLKAGADGHKANNNGATPMWDACVEGRLETVQLLSSYGVSRSLREGHTAEQIALHFGHAAVVEWLRSTREWSTPLHHLAIISVERTRALVRQGANLHASASVGGPTPLSIARELRESGEAPMGSAAELVLKAAKPWSPATHDLFSDAAQAYVKQMMAIGQQQSRLPLDVWTVHVMPDLVTSFLAGAAEDSRAKERGAESRRMASRNLYGMLCGSSSTTRPRGRVGRAAWGCSTVVAQNARG